MPDVSKTRSRLGAQIPEEHPLAMDAVEQAAAGLLERMRTARGLEAAHEGLVAGLQEKEP